MADKLSNTLSDHIANLETIQTGTLTIPSGVTASYKECYKVGNVVTLYILASKTTWSESDLVATVPSGFRPKTTQYYVPIVNYNNTSNNDVARISSSDGQILVWSKGTQPSGNIYISATYICDD